MKAILEGPILGLSEGEEGMAATALRAIDSPNAAVSGLGYAALGAMAGLMRGEEGSADALVSSMEALQAASE